MCKSKLTTIQYKIRFWFLLTIFTRCLVLVTGGSGCFWHFVVLFLLLLLVSWSQETKIFHYKKNWFYVMDCHKLCRQTHTRNISAFLGQNWYNRWVFTGNISCLEKILCYWHQIHLEYALMLALLPSLKCWLDWI